MTHVLTPEPLTREAFSSFGDVIEARHEASHLINEGRTRRFHALAEAEPGPDGKPILSIFRGTPWPSPLTVRMLERHPLGSQAFVPMQDHAWLVVVASDARSADCRCFLARGDQGVQIARGVWHHPLLVLQPMQDFLVVDRSGPGVNLEEVFFPEGEGVVIAPV